MTGVQMYAAQESNVKKVDYKIDISNIQPASGVTIGHSDSHIVVVLRNEENYPFAYVAFEPKALKYMLEKDDLWISSLQQ